MKLKNVICLGLGMLISTTALTTYAKSSTTSFSPDQTRDIQKIIHDYLVNNPQVLVEASQALQQQQMVSQEKTIEKGIVANKNKLFFDPNSPAVGNGNTYLVEFFDYQCGHCRTMAPIVEDLAKTHKELKIIFKELPIFGGDSENAAKAALAANMQGKYFEFHNALFNATNGISEKELMKIAKSVGLDTKKLKHDMKSSVVTNQIRANFDLAQKLQLAGTPAFIISNKGINKFGFIPGATSESDLESHIKKVSN